MKHASQNVASEEKIQKSSEITQKIVSTKYLGCLCKERD